VTASDAAVKERQRKIDFYAGGWVLMLAGVLCLFVIGQWAYRIANAPRAIGDGEHVETYGYNLATTLVPRSQLMASGMPKDGLAAMVEPNVFTPAEAAAYSKRIRKSHEGKFLVDKDRVIGVERNGEYRAYPLRIITWHEVINDTLGGEPILVTYNPLCDSTVVFDREVGGQVREFGLSGLVYNSNLLMYDRQEDPNAESLWCQLQFRAVAGPAAARGLTLDVQPAVVTHWAAWRDAHPRDHSRGARLRPVQTLQAHLRSVLPLQQATVRGAADSAGRRVGAEGPHRGAARRSRLACVPAGADRGGRW
jgi:hypothetical protein